MSRVRSLHGGEPPAGERSWPILLREVNGVWTWVYPDELCREGGLPGVIDAEVCSYDGTAPAGDEPPSCPDTEALVAVLPQPGTADVWYVAGDERNPPAVPQCSGDLAVTTVFRAFHEQPGTTVDGVPVQPGEVGMTGGVGLFRYVDGAWTSVDREEYCGAGLVPDDLHAWACETG